MAIPGFFGGGMIGALVAMGAGGARGCVPPDGFPACNLWAFVVPASVIGIVLLPSMILWRLRRVSGNTQNSARS